MPVFRTGCTCPRESPSNSIEQTKEQITIISSGKRINQGQRAAPIAIRTHVRLAVAGGARHDVLPPPSGTHLHLAGRSETAPFHDYVVVVVTMDSPTYP
jgi:hypothetical protein